MITNVLPHFFYESQRSFQLRLSFHTMSWKRNLTEVTEICFHFQEPECSVLLHYFNVVRLHNSLLASNHKD